MALTSGLSVIPPVVILWLVYRTASFTIQLYRVRSRFQRMQKECLVSGYLALTPSMSFCRLF